MIYLRTITDDSGDTVDLAWYCSHICYSDSLRADPPTKSFEEGGAYPCGAEHDLPDYCATCGAPVGNPLTSEGEAYVRETVRELHDLDGFDTRDREERIAKAQALREEYSYLFA